MTAVCERKRKRVPASSGEDRGVEKVAGAILKQEDTADPQRETEVRQMQMRNEHPQTGDFQKGFPKGRHLRPPRLPHTHSIPFLSLDAQIGQESRCTIKL